MRTLVLGFLLFAAIPRLLAHDHIEVGLDPADESRLAMAGPSVQLALYVPPGEPFSGYMPQFPGGYYADELTFSSEGAALDFPAGSLPKVEVVSVAGPAGGRFSFWEAGASAPTWTRGVGWSATDEDKPSITVYQDATGYGHVHGRAFTVDRPGTYTVVFRAVDVTASSPRSPSAAKTVAFNALATPQLSIRIEAGEAKLGFASRLGLSYDLQVSTDLTTWTTINFADGSGIEVQFSDPLDNRPRVFYRLVEYY